MNPTTENTPTLGHGQWVCVKHADDVFQHAPVAGLDTDGHPVVATRDGLLCIADLDLPYVVYDLCVVRKAVQDMLTETETA